MKRRIGPAMLVIALTGFATLAEAQTVNWPPPHYAVTRLPTLGGSESNGYGGVTHKGWVSGDSFLPAHATEPADATEHAFVWRGAVMTDLGTLGGKNSSVPWPQKNTHGLIVGQAEGAEIDPKGEKWGLAYGCNTTSGFCDGCETTQSCQVQFGFVWQNGMMTPLPPLPGGHNSTATSDNNKNPGVVVGWAETGAKDPKCIPPQQLDIKAVVYEPGFQNGRVVYQPYKLPPVTGDEDDLSVAFGINDNGDAVGATGTCGPPIRPR